MKGGWGREWQRGMGEGVVGTNGGGELMGTWRGERVVGTDGGLSFVIWLCCHMAAGNIPAMEVKFSPQGWPQSYQAQPWLSYRFNMAILPLKSTRAWQELQEDNKDLVIIVKGGEGSLCNVTCYTVEKNSSDNICTRM